LACEFTTDSNRAAHRCCGFMTTPNPSSKTITGKEENDYMAEEAHDKTDNDRIL
jgi:hypothetical protein